MATTTNYGWTTPDDTALVKDGAAAIRTLGSSVDTTTKNLNPSTTLGDIEYRSSTANTNTRLPIGSSGQFLSVVGGVPAWAALTDQTPLTTKGDLFTFSTIDDRLGVGADGTVLTAASGEATGLKWATPPSGSTLISRTSFSASSSVTVDSLFSSTYENYLVCVQATSSVGNVNLQMRARYGSTTHTGANYQYAFSGTDTASATAQGFRANGVTAWVLGLLATTEVNINNFTFFRQDASAHLTFTGGVVNKENGYILSGGAFVQSNQSWTGLNIFPASGTITGQITVYGLAKA